MKLLVFTTLFPNPSVPHHGNFVLERLRHWLAQPGGRREAVVIAPVPWIPKQLARGRYAAYRSIPAEEERAGLRVLHPRYALLPKVGMSVAPLSLARAGLKCARRLIEAGERFDLIDAHYLYPDGVAAASIAKRLQLPFVVTARGTDVTLIPRHALPRRWLRWMLKRARAGVVVADALKPEVARLAPPELPLVTLRNGVDLERFRPLPREQARAELGWPLDRRIVLSIGHLIERKGHHHLIAALPQLPYDVDVKIVGTGEWRERLEVQAARIGASHRVEFCGAMPHERLHVACSAADVLALLSSREGWPNVVLESLASGTPVVATRAGGTPEILRDPSIGTLVDSTAPSAVAAAISGLLARPPDRAALRAFAERNSWSETVEALDRLYLQAAARAGTGSAPAGSAT
jgi:glycosyltransferase involved in cell wall biosynthesis